MFDIAFIVTAVVLFMGLIVSEFYIRTRGTTAILVAVEDLGIPTMGLLLKAQLKLNDDRQIEADLPGCTACMDQLRIGDRVRFIQAPGGFRITGRVTSRRNGNPSDCVCSDSQTATYSGTGVPQ